MFLRTQGKKINKKTLIFWHTKFIWVLPILIQHISMAYHQPQEYHLRNNTKRWQVAKTCFLSFFLLSIIQLFLLQLPLSQVSANINSNIEIVHVSLWAAPLPSPHPWEKAAAPAQSRGKSKQILGDLGETTTILNLLPCMTHATIPWIQWFCTHPTVAVSTLFPKSLPWFKGSPVMKSLPHHLTICFPQIELLFKVKNSWRKMKLEI